MAKKVTTDDQLQIEVDRLFLESEQHFTIDMFINPINGPNLRTGFDPTTHKMALDSWMQSTCIPNTYHVLEINY